MSDEPPSIPPEFDPVEAIRAHRDGGDEPSSDSYEVIDGWIWCDRIAAVHHVFEDDHGCVVADHHPLYVEVGNG